MSALLSDADLNDFISPGLACVKPTQTLREKKPDNGEIEVGKEPTELEKVSISLQDCLACAGCITSSEEILLSRQSHTVFLKAWEELPAGVPLVVSIPPQCRLSLARFYEMTLEEFDGCFIGIMTKRFHAKYVVGTQLGRNIAVCETIKALAEKKKDGDQVKPLLGAVCPGFVLYSEKTKPQLVPYLLDVKSPQQITGSLLKETCGKVYHLTIMPCFDKKLEASRKDGEGEVDCVITPREFVTMMQEVGIDISSYRVQAQVESLQRACSPPGWDPLVHWASNAGSSSGGYAYQYVLHQQSLHANSDIITITGKNSDTREYRLVDSKTGATLASASEVYGFRNIQNLVRKLISPGSSNRNVKVLRKRTPAAAQKSASQQTGIVDASKTEFVEVMACPGGCINGGGLLNGEQNSTRRRALARDLDRQYHDQLRQVGCQENVSDTYKSYKYQFTAIASASDVVTVGNTW
ncbi:LAFE_0H00738g1_1 [Lachancea fermentati]|uniref:Cytosolic Fe-S cluster assembly factor NAR1 n=1 Tax=Lachancea fermentati TaxID=4955 RepID=A0A1G4MJ94_LACFM|nr:LAFE_0H00738g1_1 [Lachancea fermentati]